MDEQTVPVSKRAVTSSAIEMFYDRYVSKYSSEKTSNAYNQKYSTIIIIVKHVKDKTCNVSSKKCKI